MRSDDKLILACIDFLGMSPDEAINYVRAFPYLAKVSVEHAKVESEKYKKAYAEKKRKMDIHGTTAKTP